MARRTRTTSVKIMTYGCLPPSEEVKRVLDGQLRLAHNYYNKLAKIETDRFNEYTATRSAMYPDLDRLEKEYAVLEGKVESVCEQIKLDRSHLKVEKSGVKKDPAKLAALASLKAAKASVGKSLSAEKEALNKAMKPADDYFKAKVAETLKKMGKVGPRAVSVANAEVLEEMLKDKRWPEFWRVKEKIDATAEALRREARKGCGLHDGTYGLIERAINSAKVNSAKQGKGPEQKFFRGEGRVCGVQFKTEVTVAEVLAGKNNLLSIAPPTYHAQGNQKEGSRRCGNRTEVSILVNTDDSRKPVRVTIPMVMHRPLPADGRVTLAWILIRKVGAKTTYELQLTVESAESGERSSSAKGVAAVHIGWRTREDGSFRVGYLVDDRGGTREFTLSPVLRDRLKSGEMIAAQRQKLFDEAKEVVASWVKRHPKLAPTFITRRNISKWRASAKLANLVRKWVAGFEDPLYEGEIQVGVEKVPSLMPAEKLLSIWNTWRMERFGYVLMGGAERRANWKNGTHEGKPSLFTSFDEIQSWLIDKGVKNPVHQIGLYLEWWRRQDLHMEQWQKNGHEKALRARDEEYKKWARELECTYQTVVWDDFRLDTIARLPDAEKGPDAQTPRTNRQLVAPSKFRLAVDSKMGKNYSVRAKAEGNREASDDVDQDLLSAKRLLEAYYTGSVAKVG